MIENIFTLRAYSKCELAMLYAPQSTPETAIKNLYRWIQRCEPLKVELKNLHYNPRRLSFMKREVAAIVKHLGEP